MTLLHTIPSTKNESLRQSMQDSWALIKQLPSESDPRSSSDRTGEDAVRRHGARIRRAPRSLLPTLTRLEDQLSGHHQGQHKQCSLHYGSSWSALLRARFCLFYKPLASPRLYKPRPAHFPPSWITGLWPGSWHRWLSWPLGYLLWKIILL